MFDTDTDDTTIQLPPVSKHNREALERFAPIYTDEYEGYKEDFLIWLHQKGKNPFKGDGYAQSTVKTTHYKIEKAYRWKWQQADEFTKTFTPGDAESLIDKLVSETTLKDREVRDYIKAIKRLFRWFSDTGGKRYDWEYSKIGQLEQQGASKRQHYFKRDEMNSLYNAAIEYGSMKSYRTVNPDERDRLKATLAQRLGKKKTDIGPDDFADANSWKFPSLIAISIDLGLRPIEIKRANTHWLQLDNQEVVVPKDEASKSDDTWECVLSSRSVRALERWLEERRGYEKYDDSESIWLTKYGNGYESWSLNSLLDTLLDLTDIKPRNRQLTWYSIRRGAATMWADRVDLNEARVQLRHKKLETTKRYTKSASNKRKEQAENNW